MKQHKKIILASGSPRRREFLKNMGLKIDVQPSEINEDGFLGNPEKISSLIVQEKMKAAKAKLEPTFAGFVLVADTIVALGKDVFGKPDDLSQAKTILQKLSGQTHQVYTCFRIENLQGFFVEKTVCTNVVMRAISAEMMSWYISTCEPLDKAGAYAIQGYGSVLVESIQGSYTNVVGLPMAEVMDALVELKVISF